MPVVIRRETPDDHREVEALIRAAFWNENVPGCNEHYLAHLLRRHPDFLPELDLVAEQEGRVVGQIMYTLSRLTDAAGEQKTVLTFGPLSVLPGCQRQGIGKRLMRDSFARAANMGYDAVVIFGNPDNYVSSGFQSGARFGLHVGDGFCPSALLARELTPGALSGPARRFKESPAFEGLDEQAAERFDRTFPPMEKGWRPSQEMFYILSHSGIRF